MPPAIVPNGEVRVLLLTAHCGHTGDVVLVCTMSSHPCEPLASLCCVTGSACVVCEGVGGGAGSHGAEVAPRLRLRAVRGTSLPDTAAHEARARRVRDAALFCGCGCASIWPLYTRYVWSCLYGIIKNAKRRETSIKMRAADAPPAPRGDTAPRSSTERSTRAPPRPAPTRHRAPARHRAHRTRTQMMQGALSR